MIDFSVFLTLDGWISLLTLSVLEIVLGIDNVIFISIVASKLAIREQKRARSIGLMLALLIRIALLFSITWIIGLKEPLFFIADFGCTGRDIILFSGGVFLIVKTIMEIVEKLSGAETKGPGAAAKLTVNSAIAQIVFIDVIFSFDSILTAVGLVKDLVLMILAVIIAMFIMLAFSGAVSNFINRHPTVKMLALAFLIMIGVALVAEGLHMHVDKAYIYVALLFSLGVELLNMKGRSNSHRHRDGDR